MQALVRRLSALPLVGSLLSSWRGRFIGGFLALQLLLPLHYYAGRADPHDERFAWRMFSPMRMTRCKPTLYIGGAPRNLGTEFHEAWLEIASRGRLGVIEEMGARLCAKYPQQEIRLSIDCAYLGRPPQAYGGHDICSVPEL